MRKESLNIIAIIVLIPIMSGLIQIILVKAGTESPAYQSYLNRYHGLLQRIFAVIAIGPIGVGAYVLMNRTEGPACETATL